MELGGHAPPAPVMQQMGLQPAAEAIFGCCNLPADPAGCTGQLCQALGPQQEGRQGQLMPPPNNPQQNLQQSEGVTAGGAAAAGRQHVGHAFPEQATAVRTWQTHHQAATAPPTLQKAAPGGSHHHARPSVAEPSSQAHPPPPAGSTQDS